VAVRTSGIPEGADSGWWIREANGGSKGPATRDGKVVPGLSLVVTQFPKGLATCTVRFSVAAGPWQTVDTTDGSVGNGVSSREGPSYSFGEAIATRRGTALAVMHNIQDKAVRLVAVDLDGKEHPAVHWSGAGVKDFQLLSAEFDIIPEQIREFRLQYRPYERVEIPNVAL
jgi:hypothetical protein